MYKKCLIQPYAKPLRNGKENAKNYPYWEELVKLLQSEGYEITQLQSGDEKVIANLKLLRGSLSQIESALQYFDFFIAIDSFLPHMAHCHNKAGVVLWGKSDPAVFGYHENLNLHNGKSWMTRAQYWPWEDEPFEAEAFMKPAEVVAKIKERFPIAN